VQKLVNDLTCRKKYCFNVLSIFCKAYLFVAEKVLLCRPPLKAVVMSIARLPTKEGLKMMILEEEASVVYAFPII